MNKSIQVFSILLFSVCTMFSVQSLANAQAEIDAAMSSSYDVKVFHKRSWIGGSRFYGFEPRNPVKKVGIIIYPGAFVDPKAYAPIARHAADNGYYAAIVTPILNFAFLGAQYATYVKDHWGSKVDNYIVSGHSLGGTVAAMYANYNDKPGDKVGALFLLASYPTPGLDDLSNDPYLVTSVWGSNDGLTTESNITGSERWLPADTRFVEIVGGNHTQFYYSDSLQSGDNPATISRDEQQAIIKEEMQLLFDML